MQLPGWACRMCCTSSSGQVRISIQPFAKDQLFILIRLYINECSALQANMTSRLTDQQKDMRKLLLGLQNKGSKRTWKNSLLTCYLLKLQVTNSISLNGVAFLTCPLVTKKRSLSLFHDNSFTSNLNCFSAFTYANDFYHHRYNI